MKRKFLRLSAIFFLFLSAYANAYADPWKFEVAPYVWAVNMNGRVQTGPIRVHVDQSFDDILHHLNFGAMFAVDATKDRFGLFGNVMYAVLSDKTSDSLLALNLKNKFGLFSAGASYQVVNYNFNGAPMKPDSVALEPYIGLRYTLNNVRTTLSFESFSISNTDNHHWTDPIVGLRAKLFLSKLWSLILAGDVGGTNASSDYSYNLIGLLGYKPQTHFVDTKLYLGYRLLSQHYITGRGLNYYNWNMKIFGPMVGITIAF